MKFARRKRTAEVILGVGQSKRWLLPPMTAGVIQVIVRAVFRDNEVEPPDDGSGTPPMPFNPDMVGGGGAASAGSSAGSGQNSPGLVMHLDDPFSTHNPATEVDGGGGGSGGDSNPSPDVSIELKRIHRTIKTTPVGNLIHEALGDSPDWNIVLTRNPDVHPRRRQFMVTVIYMSVLPEEERRVPLAFLNRGFDLNWNEPSGGVQFLRGISIEGRSISYFLEAVFAELYNLEKENIFVVVSEPLFPKIHSVAPIRVLAAIDTDSEEAVGGPRFYFALQLNMRCQDSRQIELPNLPNARLPQEFGLEARFYLQFLEGGGLAYYPKITTTLSIDWLPVIDHFGLRALIRDRIEEALRSAERFLFAAQWDNTTFRSLFDKHLKPWLIGNYEVTGIRAEPDTNELVLTHVGRRVQKRIANDADPDAPTGIGWNMVTNPRPPRLFKTEGEFFEPAVPLGGDPGVGPLRPATNPGALAKIDHIVVLMMENRSFDHILGHLSRDLGHDEVEGLLPGDNDRDWNDADRIEFRDEGIRFRSRRITDTTWPVAVSGPCHGHNCTMRQMADGMKHFVTDFSDREPARADAQRVMDYFGDGVLKAYDGLKRHFAICDHWFGSHIGGTLPNRHITFSGDLNRDPLGAPEEENSHLSTYSPTERKTFFDVLTDKGVTWRLYEHGYSFLRLYRKYTFDLDRIRGFSEFEQAAKEGLLPSVSFIEPDYIEAPPGNDDHAPADMIEGQRLVAKIVKALINGPRWENTLLIITYDEHGGFYDHVVPPDRIETELPDGTIQTRQIPPIANGIRQLGPRVPAFVISPFTPGERPNPDGDVPPTRLTVSKQVFEHASIPATILRRFCSPRPAFLSDRVDEAQDLRELLSLDQARPKSEFAALLAVLEEVIAAPQSSSPVQANRLNALRPGELDAREDFHGALLYASAMTGRGLA